MWVPVAVSHSRAVLSQLAVASRAPSGLNSTPHTLSLWPVRVRVRARTWRDCARAGGAAGGVVLVPG